MRRLAGRRAASRAGSAAAETDPGAEAQVVAHGHCHQKAFRGTGPLTAALEATGARVRTLDSGCCGMAGSGRDALHPAQYIARAITPGD